MGAREWGSDEALGQLGCHTRPDPDARRDPRAGCKTAPRCLASRGRFVVDRSAIKTLVRGANHDIAKDTDSATPAKSSKSHDVGYFRPKKTAETHSSRVSATPVFFARSAQADRSSYLLRRRRLITMPKRPMLANAVVLGSGTKTPTRSVSNLSTAVVE